MKIADFLQARRVEINELTSIVKQVFVPLSQEVQNRKPAAGKWSIAECFQHLNLTMEVYVSQMLDVVEKHEQYPQTEQAFKLSFMGQMGVKAMQPKDGGRISYKMKTFNVLNPEVSKVADDPIRRFLAFQEDLLKVTTGLEKMSLTKPKITTVLGPIIKMPVGDALHFMIAHNQRHILQAQKVLEIIQ